MMVEVTKYGFIYGPVEVERTLSDDRYGVLLTIKGKKGAVEIRVTPGGRVTVEKKRPLFDYEKKERA